MSFIHISYQRLPPALLQPASTFVSGVIISKINSLLVALIYIPLVLISLQQSFVTSHSNEHRQTQHIFTQAYLPPVPVSSQAAAGCLASHQVYGKGQGNSTAVGMHS